MKIIFLALLMATPFEDGSQALLAGESQKAVDAFTVSIEAKPTAKAHVNRGIAYRRLGKLKEAFHDCNAAIRLDPREPVAYINRGRLYEDAKLPVKAIADYTKALQLKPDATTYAIRGTTHQKAKDYASARDGYRAALKLNPNELTALNNLAWMQATCPKDEFRDGDSAVRIATRACQLTQFRVKDYVATLAAAYAEVGDFKRAVALAAKIDDERLTQYRKGRPVRDAGDQPKQ